MKPRRSRVRSPSAVPTTPPAPPTADDAGGAGDIRNGQLVLVVDSRPLIRDGVARAIEAHAPDTRLEPSLVVEALRLVVAGGTFAPAESLLAGLDAAGGAEPRAEPVRPAGSGGRMAAPAPSLEALTPRQLAVLELLRQGASNKAIARSLDLPESTVKAEVRHIMRKLGAANRTQVAMLLAR